MKYIPEDAVLKNIFTRKSIRKFIDKPISAHTLDILCQAGMSAPSAKNMQPWHFVVVTEREMLDGLGNALPYAKMLFGAKAAIVVCADIEINNNGLRYWEVDCAAATQNILLAAHALGLGAVWTATHPYPERLEPVANLLNLPDHITSLCVIPLGYPEGENPPKDKYIPEKIHLEKW